MTTNSTNDHNEFFRKVLATSADKFFDGLKKDESLTQKDLENQTKINDHKRGETAKQCWHRAEVFIIWFVLIAIISLGFSFIWHLVTPWPYLSDKQIDQIHTILSSAILASVLSSRFKRYFS